MNLLKHKSGFTLVELTIVITVILTLIGVGLGVSTQYTTWQKARSASEDLRSVYAAQRLYLSDNPTAPVANLTASDLIPYLAGSATELPTIEDLDGIERQIRFTVSPPVVNGGGNTVYDPSGSPTDSLWDVGE